MAKKDDKFFTQSVEVSIPSQNFELDTRSVQLQMVCKETTYQLEMKQK